MGHVQNMKTPPTSSAQRTFQRPPQPLPQGGVYFPGVHSTSFLTGPGGAVEPVHHVGQAGYPDLSGSFHFFNARASSW
jgi:hypothetical protein